MDSYWELYLSYIRHCEKYNNKYDIDPHHYQMEWNHTLPQCVFGDQPFGQWLTKRQHAIASALQTLVYKKNCMCAWHKKYLSKELLKLAWPYYRKASAENGKTGGEIGGIKSAITNKKNKTGLYDPQVRELSHSRSRKPIRLICLKTGEVLSFRSLNEASITLNLNRSGLSLTCNGKQQYVGGYTAEFLVNE
jgi:hypothetical protein